MKYPYMRREKGTWSSFEYEKMLEEIGRLGKQSENIVIKIGEKTSIFDRRQIDTLALRYFDFKVIQWAMDFKDRREEYERFANYYVDKPSFEEAPGYFFRPYKNEKRANPHVVLKEPRNYVPRIGTWTPNAVDLQDRTEANRLILEYHFFIPPSGRAFENDFYRSNLTDALLSLEDIQNSIIVFEKDLEIIVNLQENEGMGEIFAKWKPAGSAVNFLFRTPSLPSYRVLAKYFNNSVVQDHFDHLASFWSDNPKAKDDQVHRIFREWQLLTEHKWDTPEEIALAKWLKSIPAPREPIVPTGEFDPNDPFSQVPPPPGYQRLDELEENKKPIR